MGSQRGLGALAVLGHLVPDREKAQSPQIPSTRRDVPLSNTVSKEIFAFKGYRTRLAFSSLKCLLIFSQFEVLFF